MKYGQKLKLEDAHVTPRNIQEVQASKLGDAQGITFFINKVSGHFSIRYIFIASCIMCYSWSVFIFVVCFISNKYGPLHILLWSETRSAVLHFVWERDTLHRTLFSSCFSFISVQSLLVFLVWLALWFLLIIIYESCFKLVDWCWIRVKSL